MECSKTARLLPRVEQPSLGAELRAAGYRTVLRIAAAAIGSVEGRKTSLEEAQRALAEIDTILCIAHDLEYLPSKDYERMEALSTSTGKTLYGYLRKLEGGAPVTASGST